MLNKVPIAKPDQVTEGSENNLQNIKEAQQDMCLAYLNGSAGVMVSGIIWFVSGLVALFLSPDNAVWTLLIGGALIHPISILFNKILGASGTHTRTNPLGSLAMEGTIFMIMLIPLAYVLSFQKTEWFFQSMLLIIGGRYLIFATIYGISLYWILGGGLGIAAYLLFFLNSSSYISIMLGSAIELSFGCFLLISAKKRKSTLIRENNRNDQPQTTE